MSRPTSEDSGATSHGPPKTDSSLSTSNGKPTSSRRKTPRPLPNIVVTPAKTGLKAKRRRADSSDDTDDSPPQKTTSKRTKLEVPKDDGKEAVQRSTESSAIYPSPISAIFPQTPVTAVPPTLRPGNGLLTLHDGVVKPATLPSPPKTPLRSGKPFNMFSAFLRHPELILNLAKVLHPTSLVDLYAISKPFHFILNSHYTTYMKANMEHNAPQSNLIFPWRCYARLCIKDPGWRPHASKTGQARDIPSLRWLQMVVYRDEIIRDILMCLCKTGLILPKGIELTLKKMWFLCDLPGNGNRIGVLHNAGYFLDRDVYLAQMFIMKLDMRFSDPVDGGGETHLRKLMFGMRNFVPLRNLLMGKFTLLHLMQRTVFYQYSPSPPNRAQNLSIFGIAANMIGNGNTEQWGRGTQRLLRIDEGVMREACRRELNTHKYLIEFMIFGYVELAARQVKKKDMHKMKDKISDVAQRRKETLEQLAFYRKAKKVEPIRVPSDENNVADVEDVDDIKGGELKDESGSGSN